MEHFNLLFMIFLKTVLVCKLVLGIPFKILHEDIFFISPDMFEATYRQF